MTYRVKEIFSTVQGEGFWTGTPSIFIRLVGCNLWSGYNDDRERDAERHDVLCPLFCDTDFTKEGSRSMTKEEIVEEVVPLGLYTGARTIVFTGGEPLLQLDADLVAALQDNGFRVSVETNGTITLSSRGFTIGGHLPDWITVSPKVTVPVIEVFDELKLILPSYADRLELHSWIRRMTTSVMGRPGDGQSRSLRFPDYKSGPALFVQPEDGPRFDEAVKACVEWLNVFPNFRLSVQTHKILKLP